MSDKEFFNEQRLANVIADLTAQLSAVTAERDALVKERWSVVATRNAAIEERDDALAELSELRARVERAKVLLPKIIEDHEYDEGKYGVYDDLVALLAILEGDEK